jgi:beta-lactamase class A
MAQLLAKLAKGQLLSQASNRVLLDMMGRCRTGEKRLKGMLPPKTPIAHKTGTIGGTVNDVGVITLPNASRIVVAAFVKKSSRPVEDREQAIAQIARAIYDYYLFSSRN